MYQVIKDDKYYLYNDIGEELMTITFDNSAPGDQVVITTPSEVYAGPIKFVTFSGDISKE